MTGLTDKQIAQEENFLKGIPRLNLGALFLPPVWGPAHGMWPTIFFYPLWLLADNLFYLAWSERSALAIGAALLVGLSLCAATIGFAILAQPFAVHRATAKGIDKETYLKRERIWALVCIVVGVGMLAGATYYNLMIRPTFGVWQG